MPRINFTVNGVKVEIEDLGAPMNSEFQLFYQEVMSSPRRPDWVRHRSQLFQFLNSHSSPSDHDLYFSNLTVAWQLLLSDPNYLGSVDFWLNAIQAAVDWENANSPSRVHKGTPLYFLGITHILARSLERGFLAMHRALDEDTQTGNTRTPNTPAYAFVTLNSANSNQFFHPWVVNLASYVDKKLDEFQQNWSGTLTFAELTTRFLSNVNFREEAFYFVSTSARFREFESGAIRLETMSEFGSTVQLRTLFDLCVILDRVIGDKIPVGKNSWKFAVRIPWLYGKIGNAGSFERELHNVNSLIKKGTSLDSIISDLLNLKHKFVALSSPSRVEAGLLIAHIVRNHGAHTLDPLFVVAQRFSEMLSGIMGSLFLAVQELLP